MKSGLLAIWLIVLVPQYSVAQSKSDKKVIKNLKATITYLASDELGGRLTGSEGEQKAATYIEDQYKKAGIQPYRGKYLYPFHFSNGREIASPSLIKIGNASLKNEDAFPLPFSFSKHVYSELLPDVLEAGNIWMIPLYSDKEEAEDPHFDWEHSMYDRSKEAATQGATAVLFYDGYGSQYAPVFNRHSTYETAELPAAFITYQAYQQYIVNNKNEANQHASGLPVDMNVFVKKTEGTANNIAACIDNHAPYTIVLGAHYDHLGHGEDGNSLYTGKEKLLHPGADDNASGTAALLQLATWVKKNNLRHYNYLFVHFSGEELGLLGSKNFVKEAGLDSAHIACMINMDMVGRLNDSTHKLFVGGVGTAPAWGSYISTADKDFNIVIDSSGVGPSDHTSFYNSGIPVLFFFTGQHSDYHRPGDIETKINYTGELAVLHYIYNIVAKMDKSPKPVFTATRQQMPGMADFKVTLGIMPDYAYAGKGLRVDALSDGRPAMKAGIKAGDIIIKLGTYPVRGMQSYMEALGHFKSGDKIEVSLKRKGKELKLFLQFDKKQL